MLKTIRSGLKGYGAYQPDQAACDDNSVRQCLRETQTMNARRERMSQLQRRADRVCFLIVISDLPAIDIEIEKIKVRQRCLEPYPDREWLCDMIYESRFDRLCEQFREEGT
jgi:hypothetical protein